MRNLLHSNKSVPIRVQYQDNPFFPLRTELDKLMSSFIGQGNFEPFNFPADCFENLSVKPAIDIVDNKDCFKIIAEMAGMGEDDVAVSIHDGVLTIKGEKTTSKQDKGKNYMMREISYGNYERNIALPDSVDIGKAKASFKKGMLWIDVPKKAEHTQQSRNIEIERAA